TVETHRARINRKLAVHSTAELVRFAAMRGLLSEDGL
ncbi:MAG: LuxR C-terminal-related transcriptional regulator, partial [Polyangiaceae bacterium]